MKDLTEYFKTVLGDTIQFEKIRSQDLERLPFYMKGLFRLYRFNLMGRELVLAEVTGSEALTTTQIRRQFEKIKEVFGSNPILATRNLSSVQRKRLIEKKINFVVPRKHLYLPGLMIDLRERYDTPRGREAALPPSAQVILLYWILRRNETLEEFKLKQLAAELQYTPMTITNAIAELVRRDLCEVYGKKGKHLRFHLNRSELWHKALPLMTHPVVKIVNVEKLPNRIMLYKSNASALACYADIDEGNRHHFALDKKNFAQVGMQITPLGPSDTDTKFRLELWKYNPGILTTSTYAPPPVDPLSLYLSMKDTQDERIDKALDTMIGNIKW